MPGHGKRGKPPSGFPPFPQPLEIAMAIPTFPQLRRLSLPPLNPTKKGPKQPTSKLQSFRLILGLENAIRSEAAHPEHQLRRLAFAVPLGQHAIDLVDLGR